MSNKSVIIIGAGIGGLSAGCYGQMNGYDTHIFEMHDKPGGLCTAWDRKGYNIDVCLHWLTGSTPKNKFYHLWQEIGLVQGKQIIDSEIFYRYESTDGKALNMYTDVNRLEKHMKELAPEDAAVISEMARAVRHFTGFNMPVDKEPSLYTFWDGIKMMFQMLPFMGDMRKWGKMNMKEFSQRFKNPLLRDSWHYLWGDDFSAMAMLMTLSWMHAKDAGYVIGGSMDISRSVEKRYLALGGNIDYKARVTQIIVENDRATGIRLEDGTEHKADYVISAADGHATIFDMLGGKYISDTIRGYYDKFAIFQPLVFIGLGVNRSFADTPKTISGIVMSLEKPLMLGGVEQKSLSARIHSFDPTLAPPGKTLITCIMESRYPYWESLHQNIAAYKAEKERIADVVVSALDKRFPGLAAQVEMRDVSTPVTFKRYTGNWQGSFEGWLPTSQTLTMRMSKTLPGLSNFYMVGQWVSPGGGLPSGVMTGRWVTQLICKADRKKFVATVA